MPIDNRVLSADVKKLVLEIGQFVKTPAFEALLSELRVTAAGERGNFVEKVMLNEEELVRRGVHVPAGMMIQRSYFADNRPTLFCVSKKLPDQRFKVTITFDDRA
jgi:hypothetical protein